MNWLTVLETEKVPDQDLARGSMLHHPMMESERTLSIDSCNSGVNPFARAESSWLNHLFFKVPYFNAVTMVLKFPTHAFWGEHI